MVIKKWKLLMILLFVVFSISGGITVSGTGFSREFNVEIDSLIREDIGVGGKRYERITVGGFLNINHVGFPALPANNYLIAIPHNSNEEVFFSSLASDTSSCGDILPAPAMQTEGDQSSPIYNEQSSCYGANQFFPEKCVQIVERFEYLGVEIAKIQISPVQYNPVTKKIITHKNFKAEVKFSGGAIKSKAQIIGNKAKIIKNLVINGDEFIGRFNGSSFQELRKEKSILIVTHSDFKAAADSLAIWQRMKGYDVSVVSDTSWVVKDKNRPKALVEEKTGIVKKIVKDFYNANGQNGYLLIMGGWWFVPNELLFSSVWTDQCYTALSSNKLFGNMPRGRIACETLEEAMLSVRKIIQYESDPCMDADFYESFLIASMFEGSHENGYSEKRFALTSEEIFQYLTKEQGYSGGERVFNYNLTPTADLHPTNWNNGTYANGGLLPQHLQWPGFAWDGTKEDVSRSLNKGKFFALYRGHGQPTNWSAFKFHIDDIKKLSNRDKYPIVLSITCNTGKFDRNIYNPAWDLVCFTQEFLQVEKKGAAGVFGAAQSSFSGPNDALAHALVDAIWPTPGTICKKPSFQRVEAVVRKEPIYTMGDVALYGLGRMATDWNTGDLPMQKNLVMYHYFGDPTTKIITAVPKVLTASSSVDLPSGASSFSVTGINCGSGVATLVNMNTGKLLGRVNVSGSSVTIPVSGEYAENDIVSLTITSDGYKPYIKSLNGKVTQSVVFSNKAKNSILFNGKRVSLSLPNTGNSVVEIYDLQGRRLFEKILDNTKSSHSVDLKTREFSAGSYIIRVKNELGVLAKKITFMK